MDHSDLACADRPLGAHLDRLRLFLAPTGVRYKHVGLVDEPLPGAATTLDAVAQTPEQFEPVWQAIVRAGSRDWVNLSAVAVRVDELLVAVEHFLEPLDGRRARPDEMTVILSGPRRG